MRRLLRWAIAAWVVRWAALEAGSLLGRRRPRGPAPVDSERPPGWMPPPDLRRERDVL